MSRKKKPSGKLSKGPWTFDDLRAALESQGFAREEGAKHPQWIHPNRRGKVSLDEKWTSVRCGSTVFNSVARQAGYTKDELVRLLNK